MKIKAVCVETGLSDRAIRYYIDEGLISPNYTENYLGRKNYDFTQEDIAALKHIATLRSFDFTVEEIRSMIHDSTKSQAIIHDVRLRTEKIVTEGEKRLSVLMQLDPEKNYTVEQLAEEISQIMSYAIVHQESYRIPCSQRIIDFIKKSLIFIVVWVPVVLIVYWYRVFAAHYRYPVYDWPLLLTVVCVLPSVLLLLGAGTRFWKRKFVRGLLLSLCLVLCPVGSISTAFCVSHSETIGPYNYRFFEARCSANWDLMFQELFLPVGEIVPDRYYYYLEDLLDEYYLIYAEEEMREEKFVEEVARVTQFFEENKPTEKQVQLGATYSREQKGSFQLMVIYMPGKCLAEDTDGRYYAFAYNPSNRTVRYFHINNLWDGQQYSLDIEW